MGTWEGEIHGGEVSRADLSRRVRRTWRFEKDKRTKPRAIAARRTRRRVEETGQSDAPRALRALRALGGASEGVVSPWHAVRGGLWARGGEMTRTLSVRAKNKIGNNTRVCL